jgi:hypothetical protein
MQQQQINAIMTTPAFSEYVKSMWHPLEHGRGAVDEEYMVNTFEPELEGQEEDEDIPECARKAAWENLQSYMACMKREVEKLAAQDLMRDPDVYIGWNATDAYGLQLNLEAFTDAVFGIWEEDVFPEYCENVLPCLALNDESERKCVCNYIKEFVGFTMAQLPAFSVTAPDIRYSGMVRTNLDV